MTKDTWDALVAAFRARPGVVSHAAAAAGCAHMTAKRAWEDGIYWAKEIEFHKAIRDTIEDEQEISRARLEELREASAVKIAATEQTLALEVAAKVAEKDAQIAVAEKQRALERKRLAEIDVTNSVVEEAQLVRLARGSALSLLGSMKGMSEGAAKVGIKIQEALTAYCICEEDGTPRKLNPLELMALTRVIGSLSTSLKSAVDASARAMEMERLLLGEPSRIVGVQHSIDDVSLADAAKRIRAAYEALEAARDEGVVVDSDEPLALSDDDEGEATN